MRDWTEYITEELKKIGVTKYVDEENARPNWNNRREPIELRPMADRPCDDSGIDDCVQMRSFEARGVFCDIELISSRQLCLDDFLNAASVFYSVGFIYQSARKYALIGFDIADERAYLARAFELDLSGAQNIDERTESMRNQNKKYRELLAGALNAKSCVDSIIREFLRLRLNG